MPMWKSNYFLLFPLLVSVIVLGGLPLIKKNFELREARARNASLPDYGQFVKFDPKREGGHLRPNLNTAAVGAYAEKPVRFVTNSKGFRNVQEFNYEVPTGTYRILLLGDSFIDGMRTDQNETIGAVLEATLERELSGAPYTDAEVLISGHNNPSSAAYYLQEHGLKYQPNLVVVAITLGNDLTWHNYRSSVYSTVSDDGELVLELARKPQQTGREQPNLLLPAEAYLPEGRLTDYWSKLEFKLRRVLATNSSYFEDSVPPATGPNPSTRGNAYAGDFFTSLGLFYLPLMPEMEAFYEDFEELLWVYRRLTLKHKAQLLIVLFPTRFQVSGSDWDSLHRALRLNPARFDLNYPNRRLNEFCETNGIPVLDVTDALSHEPQSVFRPLGDMHLNEQGQKRVGEILAQRISEGMS